MMAKEREKQRSDAYMRVRLEAKPTSVGMIPAKVIGRSIMNPIELKIDYEFIKRANI
jgi:hypothetical protein